MRGDGHPYGLKIMIHETGHLYLWLEIKRSYATIKQIKEWIINYEPTKLSQRLCIEPGELTHEVIQLVVNDQDDTHPDSTLLSKAGFNVPPHLDFKYLEFRIRLRPSLAKIQMNVLIDKLHLLSFNHPTYRPEVIECAINLAPTADTETIGLLLQEKCVQIFEMILRNENQSILKLIYFVRCLPDFRKLRSHYRADKEAQFLVFEENMKVRAPIFYQHIQRRGMFFLDFVFLTGVFNNRDPRYKNLDQKEPHLFRDAVDAKEIREATDLDVPDFE